MMASINCFTKVKQNVDLKIKFYVFQQICFKYF